MSAWAVIKDFKGDNPLVELFLKPDMHQLLLKLFLSGKSLCMLALHVCVCVRVCVCVHARVRAHLSVSLCFYK